MTFPDPRDLVLSQDGGWSLSKCCYLLFVVVFTWKMLHLPDDPWLWVIYGGTVGSVQVLQKLIATRFASVGPEKGS
jgi:hypothetical protein